jgi:peptidyl-prolyl cis-trans isomerase B (cyclophilin B)
MKGPAQAPGESPKLLDRLNELGERHATAIISISTGLIILTVLIFAKYFYDKSQVERAEQELATAETMDQLTALRTKYGTTPVAPRILFRLANKYYEDGKLDDARNAYKEFQTRFPQDRLAIFVIRALKSLDHNASFETEGKEARLKQHFLSPHPRDLAGVKDPRLQWGPAPEGRPVAQIELAAGSVTVELFEDDAPNAVAAFVKLAGQNAFDGAKWEMIGGDERIQAKAKSDADLVLAPEDSKKPGEAYSLVLVKKDAGVGGGQFQILLTAVPDLRDATVFGIVTEGAAALKSVKKDDAIKSVKIVSKRTHAYEPQPLKK